MESEIPKFEVVVLGIVFDPVEKKFLIGRKGESTAEGEPGWYFPGGKMIPGEDIDNILKETIKTKTGYSIKNIGTFFSRTYDENPNRLAVYFLTRVFEGEEQPGGSIVELKWVSADELEEYCKIPLHKKLKEFLSELV